MKSHFDQLVDSQRVRIGDLDAGYIEWVGQNPDHGDYWQRYYVLLTDVCDVVVTARVAAVDDEDGVREALQEIVGTFRIQP